MEGKKIYIEEISITPKREKYIGIEDKYFEIKIDFVSLSDSYPLDGRFEATLKIDIDKVSFKFSKIKDIILEFLHPTDEILNWNEIEDEMKKFGLEET